MNPRLQYVHQSGHGQLAVSLSTKPLGGPVFLKQSIRRCACANLHPYSLISTVVIVLSICASSYVFLNQRHADQRPARPWFLEIAFVPEVGMHACTCVCMIVCTA